MEEPCPLCKTWNLNDGEDGSINVVGEEWKTVKITIDSGACDNVCPSEWAPEFVSSACAPKKFVNASGGPIKHTGEKKVVLWTGEPGYEKLSGLTFQACEVKKPLAAVHRICEKGNIVQFGPKEAHNFIFNVASKQKTWLKKEYGQYVLEATFATDQLF